MLKLIKLALLGGSLLVAALAMADAEPPSADATALEKVKVKRFDEAYAKPNVNWALYSGVVIDALDMSTTTIKAPSGTHKRDIPELNEKYTAPFKDSYMKAFSREFSDDGLLRDADTAKAGTLRIKATLLELAPTYIPDSNMSGARNRVYSETAGKIEMQFDIYDAVTGEHLAKVIDKREASRMWRENNSVQNRSQVNQVMGTWARLFRSHLDDIAEK